MTQPAQPLPATPTRIFASTRPQLTGEGRYVILATPKGNGAPEHAASRAGVPGDWGRGRRTVAAADRHFVDSRTLMIALSFLAISRAGSAVRRLRCGSAVRNVMCIFAHNTAPGPSHGTSQA